MPYCTINGVDVIPVIKCTNITYDVSGTNTPGQYAFLMYTENTDNPTVAGINSIVFPYADRDTGLVDTDNAWGVEHQFNAPISMDIDITSTSQLIVVGEYDGLVNVNSTQAVEIQMEAGFAEQYFI